MSLYFKSEEDTMKNSIFLRLQPRADRLTTKTQFFERELFQNGYKQKLSLKKGDINKGKCVHITTLLLRWTKVLDGMLFCGHLPL